MSRCNTNGTIIWVKQPLRIRFARAIARRFVDCGHERPDLAPGCQERVDWALLSDIWNFDRISRPRIEAALKRWAPDKPVICLNGDRALASFVDSIASAGSPDGAQRNPGAADRSARV
jgi:adenylate kinase family enzyme